MKLLAVLLFLVFVSLEYSLAECPAGEYNPGPDCSFEVICAPRSAHSARSHYCDCWCNPGLIRDPETKTCVEKCYIYFGNAGETASSAETPTCQIYLCQKEDGQKEKEN